MNEKQQKDFKERLCKELDASLENLDPHITRRLLQSRQKALKDKQGSWLEKLKFAAVFPARGFASLAIVVMAVSLWYTTRPQISAQKVEELEVLAIASSLDMYKELEMLQLLARMDDDN
jgi:Protein of unknown function (DUF3619)